MKLITPLHGKYLEHGANIIDVQSWQLAGTFTSVEEEYRMVREGAGFCDYPFQSAFAITGKDAFNFLQKMLVNDLRKISPGKIIYSSMVDETGKLLEDSIVFWVEETFFIINGGFNKKQTGEWLKKNMLGLNVCITEMATTFLSLQGPKSRDILQKTVNVKDMPYLSLKQDKIGDIPVLIARTGFSGELGYELHIYPEYAHELWDTLMNLGKEYKVSPYGLLVAFPLALEKGYVFGADFYEGGTPLEYGLGWTVAFDKGDFIGKEALLKRKNEGLKTKLVGFEVSDPKVIPVTGDNLVKEGKAVGKVTVAGYGSAVGKSIGRGWVEINYTSEGEELEVEHENKKTKVNVAKNYRFYDPENKKIKS